MIKSLASIIRAALFLSSVFFLSSASFGAEKVTFVKAGFERSVSAEDIVELIDTGDEQGVEILLSAMKKEDIVKQLSRSFEGLDVADADKAVRGKVGRWIIDGLAEKIKPRQQTKKDLAVKALRSAIITAVASRDNARFVDILAAYPFENVVVLLD